MSERAFTADVVGVLLRALPGLAIRLGDDWPEFRDRLKETLAILAATDLAGATASVARLVDHVDRVLPGCLDDLLSDYDPAGAVEPYPEPRVRSGTDGPGVPERLVATVDAVGGGSDFTEVAASERAVAAPPSPSPSSEEADCALFAPGTAPPGQPFLVQFWLYPPTSEDRVRALATEADSDAKRLAGQALPLQLEPGMRVDVRLEVPGCSVDEPDQSMVWRGRPDARQFGVTVPQGHATPLLGKAALAVCGVPAGSVRFKIAVEAAGGAGGQHRAPTEARAYRRGFVSYTSSDRAEVLRRVQGLKAAGVEVFQDILDLDPGDRWEQKLYERIDACDVFYLFWSRRSRESEWVRREYLYALERAQTSDGGLPEITPVPIDGPPLIPPPEELRHLHFNDALLAHIAFGELSG